ncbi:MAG TPA: hypothetical protein VK666_01035 [Chryseolinea sp.]|nr:hypothetical protein [Chryseolinea sp.]
MKIITKIFLLLLLSSTISSKIFSQAGSKFHVIKSLPIGGAGGWDYLAMDPAGKRLYISHGTQVNIIDKNSGDSLGVIPNTTGVHGIAFIPSENKGYTSNGRLNNITVFELSTGNVLSQIATGENPDAILYEPFSKTIITCNGRSKNLSVIDPVANAVISTIDVGGKPETAVSNGAGKLFVNIEDKNEIVEVDMIKREVTGHWSLDGAEGPTGLCIDNKTHRLFAGCDKQLVVINADNGKVVSKLPIGDGCDGVAFDNSTQTIFTSNGEGTMTVIKEQSADKYKIEDNVVTKKGGRTITIDEANHTLYIPTASFGTPEAEGKRPPVIPGTFMVMVISK